jgi:hypothetical protein
MKVVLFATRPTLHHLSDIRNNIPKFFGSFFVPSLGDTNPDTRSEQFYLDILRSVLRGERNPPKFLLFVLEDAEVYSVSLKHHPQSCFVSPWLV